MRKHCVAPDAYGGGECGTAFEGRSDKLTCSPACRQRLSRARPERQYSRKLTLLRKSIIYHEQDVAWRRQRLREMRERLADLENRPPEQVDLL